MCFPCIIFSLSLSLPLSLHLYLAFALFLDRPCLRCRFVNFVCHRNYLTFMPSSIGRRRISPIVNPTNNQQRKTGVLFALNIFFFLLDFSAAHTL